MRAAGIARLMRSAVDRMASLLCTTRRCGLCDSVFHDDLRCEVCPECWSQLSLFRGHRCGVCGKPLMHDNGLDQVSQGRPDHCRDCCRRTTHFDGCVFVGLYAGGLKEMVHRLKYKGFAHIGVSLGRVLADAFTEAAWPLRHCVIVPIPLHAYRLAERGYNQAELIAQGLSTMLSVPLAADALVRVRRTADQKHLVAASRARNVSGAFAVRQVSAVSGRRVLLVDDVMTTGSTINEAARMLKRSSAHSVFAAVAACGLGHACSCDGINRIRSVGVEQTRP